MSKKVTEPKAKAVKKRPMSKDIRIAILDGAWNTMFHPRFIANRKETEEIISAYIAEKIDLEKIDLLGKSLHGALKGISRLTKDERDSVVIRMQHTMVRMTFSEGSNASYDQRLRLQSMMTESHRGNNTPFSTYYNLDHINVCNEDYFSLSVPTIVGFGDQARNVTIGIHDGNYRRRLEAKAKANLALVDEATEFVKILAVALKNAKYVDDFLAQFPNFSKLVPAEQEKSYPIALIPDADRLNSLLKKYKPQDDSANS